MNKTGSKGIKPEVKKTHAVHIVLLVRYSLLMSRMEYSLNECTYLVLTIDNVTVKSRMKRNINIEM